MIAELILVITMTQASRLPASDSQSGSYQEAARYAAQAYYVQSGANKLVDQKLKDYEKNVPEDVRFLVGWTAWGYRVAQDKKVTYSWEF